MAFTVEDIFWGYKYPSDKNEIEILEATFVNQPKFVLEQSVLPIANKCNFKTTLDKVVILNTPSFERLWNYRNIINYGVLAHKIVQSQIKQILFQRNQQLEKENEHLRQELQVLYVVLCAILRCFCCVLFAHATILLFCFVFCCVLFCFVLILCVFPRYASVFLLFCFVFCCFVSFIVAVLVAHATLLFLCFVLFETAIKTRSNLYKSTIIKHKT